VSPSCGEPLELISEGQMLIAGILRLLFAHHVNHLDPAEDHASAGNGLEPKHWPYSPLNGTMILLDVIIEIGTLSDTDGLQLPS
jgi:hypothetical protein